MRKITLSLLTFALIACAFQTSHAQSADAFLDRFRGTWNGEGKSLGMPARLELKWEWVLEGQFLRLTLRNEMTSGNGKKQVFEGHAYYRGREGKYEGTWFDMRGLTFPIHGNSDGQSLISQWGSPDREEGRSVYRLLEPGKLEVFDSVKQKDGTWKEFGRFVLTRS